MLVVSMSISPRTGELDTMDRAFWGAFEPWVAIWVSPGIMWQKGFSVASAAKGGRGGRGDW